MCQYEVPKTDDVIGGDVQGVKEKGKAMQGRKHVSRDWNDARGQDRIILGHSWSKGKPRTRL